MVEARGVEPLSENQIHVAFSECILQITFPYRLPTGGRTGLVSLIHLRGPWNSRETFTAKMTPLPGRGTPGSDGCLIKQQKQDCYCYRLLLV